MHQSPWLDTVGPLLTKIKSHLHKHHNIETAGLITQTTTDKRKGGAYSAETLDKGAICVLEGQRRKLQDFIMLLKLPTI